MTTRKLLSYGSAVAVLYLAISLATWFIFSDHGIGTLTGALAGSLVYLFYIVSVFGAVTLAAIVAFMLRRERQPKIDVQ